VVNLKEILNLCFLRRIIYHARDFIYLPDGLNTSGHGHRLAKFQVYSMHILLSILGSIVTILILVNRISDSKIDFSWLNFSGWNRRKKWLKKYHADPAFSIDNPMEAAAGLMYVMAKCSGDISKEQKACMLDLFHKEFNLSEDQATQLMSSCSFILKDEDKVVENLREYLKPSLEKFDIEKKESVLNLVQQVVDCEENVTRKQTHFMDEVKTVFSPQDTSDKKWA